MPRSKTPQEEGIAFEEWFADLFDAKLQPGSGNQWFCKLDVDGRTILWSLKSTSKESLKLTPAILKEAIEHAMGAGSSGAIPGWAGQVGGEKFVVMRADDLASLFEEDVTLRRKRKADVKRARAKMPIALRRELDNDDLRIRDKILGMSQYPKIQTLWARDPDQNYDMIVGQYAKPEFLYLCDVRWFATEKVDGTNIRVFWDGHSVTFGGRTDKAQTPEFLLERLEDRFGGERMEQVFEQTFGDTPVTLYGEGYGAKIQNGGTYNPNGCDFVLFDVRINDIWLEHQEGPTSRDTVGSIAGKLGCDVVPIVAAGVPFEISDKVADGMTSTWGNFQSEGVVMKPEIGLLDRNGNRIISKLKCKDFEKLNV